MTDGIKRRCAGHFCDVAERCAMHQMDQADRRLIVDYSMAPSFKAANAAESCPMFKDKEKACSNCQNG